MFQYYLSIRYYNVIVLFVVVIFVNFSANVSAKEEGLCIFVPGWQTQGEKFNTELNEIVEILNWKYPDIQFKGKRHFWNSYFSGDILTYWDAVKNTEKAGEELYEVIEYLPDEIRKNLVLIGHSLGCRVITNALTLLDEKHLKVRQVIFFAAAVPDQEVGIEAVLSCSQEAVSSFIHPQDGALMAARHAEKLAMLGLGTIKKRSKFREYLIAKNEFSEVDHSLIGVVFSLGEQGVEYLQIYIPNHDFGLFLVAWRNSTYNLGTPIVDDIIIPQDYVNIKKDVINGKIHWDVIENCCGWELQQNIWSSHYRILHPQGYRVATGNERVKLIFDRIKEQLESTESEEYLPHIACGCILLPYIPSSKEPNRLFLASLYHKDSRIWNPESGHFEDLRTAHDMQIFKTDDELIHSFLSALQKQKKNGNMDPEVLYALGVSLYEIGKIPEAIKCWNISADFGFHKSLYELGICYLQGEGGLEDEYVGVLCLEKAMESGNLQALLTLAEFTFKKYQETQNEQDLKMYINYLKIAAQKGHPGAQYAYAFYVSPEEAFHWFKEAAYQGLSDAQFELGSLYYNNYGMEKSKYNLAYAMAWFKRAAEQGHVVAAYNVGLIYLYQEDEKLQWNPWEAEKWLKIAAEANYDNAKELYEKAKNFNRALENK